jgi:hypothetical protein
MIIKKADNIIGVPKKIFAIKGVSSAKVPAGNKYNTTF